MHTTPFLLVGKRAENYLECWSRGFSRNAIKLSSSYGVGVHSFSFGNAVSS